MEVLLGLCVLLILLILWAVSIYNRLVSLKNRVEEGWSGIDVQLKRRANLIPNLLQTVKGYMNHEKDVLENVTALRSRSMAAQAPTEKAEAESMLGLALGKLFALAESYPELKANENFIELHEALENTEEQIQMARRYYNGTVRDLNTLIGQFPSNIIAQRFQFRTASFFELEDPAERAVPNVSFS